MTLTGWVRQIIRQVWRWLPERPIVIMADSTFAALDFLGATRKHVTIITRLRLDAALHALAPTRRLRQRGRSRKNEALLSASSEVVAGARTQCPSLTAPFRYGEQNRVLQVDSAMALWYHSGTPAIDPALDLDLQFAWAIRNADFALHRRPCHTGFYSRLIRAMLADGSDC